MVRSQRYLPAKKTEENIKQRRKQSINHVGRASSRPGAENKATQEQESNSLQTNPQQYNRNLPKNKEIWKWWIDPANWKSSDNLRATKHSFVTGITPISPISPISRICTPNQTPDGFCARERRLGRGIPKLSVKIVMNDTWKPRSVHRSFVFVSDRNLTAWKTAGRILCVCFFFFKLAANILWNHRF